MDATRSKTLDGQSPATAGIKALYRLLYQQVAVTNAALKPWTSQLGLKARLRGIPMETGLYRGALVLETKHVPVFLEVAEQVETGGRARTAFLVWASQLDGELLATHEYGLAAIIAAFTALFGFEVLAALTAQNRADGVPGSADGARLAVDLTDRLALTVSHDNRQSRGEAHVQLRLLGNAYSLARVRPTEDASIYTVDLPGGITKKVPGTVAEAMTEALTQLFSLSLLDLLVAPQDGRVPPDHLDS